MAFSYVERSKYQTDPRDNFEKTRLNFSNLFSGAAGCSAPDYAPLIVNVRGIKRFLPEDTNMQFSPDVTVRGKNAKTNY